MHVCGLQYDIAWEAKTENFDRLRRLVDAVDFPPDTLLALPEMFSTGFSMDVETIREAEERPGERFLTELARDRRIHVLGGVVNREEDDMARNQCLVVGPDGNELARYAKLHPFCLGAEYKHFRGGDEIVTFPWGEVTVAPFVCYDLRFPEIFRHAALRGAGLFVVIANWPAVRADHWRTLLRARAIENQAYVLGVNRIGRDPQLAYRGDSMLIDPRGDIVADAGTCSGPVGGNIDLELLRGQRRGFPVLKDVRRSFLGLP